MSDRERLLPCEGNGTCCNRPEFDRTLNPCPPERARDKQIEGIEKKISAMSKMVGELEKAHATLRTAARRCDYIVTTCESKKEMRMEAHAIKRLCEDVLHETPAPAPVYDGYLLAARHDPDVGAYVFWEDVREHHGKKWAKKLAKLMTCCTFCAVEGQAAIYYNDYKRFAAVLDK